MFVVEAPGYFFLKAHLQFRCGLATRERDDARMQTLVITKVPHLFDAKHQLLDSRESAPFVVVSCTFRLLRAEISSTLRLRPRVSEQCSDQPSEKPALFSGEPDKPWQGGAA